MKVTDQPGRWVALFLVAPSLGAMGYRLRIDDKMNKKFGIILIVFSVVFFMYELFWITKASKKACI
tara:strand:+ start:1549 stop:1746 length:198 start_codon:yes stop_codon:yes gene_type:complete